MGDCCYLRDAAMIKMAASFWPSPIKSLRFHFFHQRQMQKSLVVAGQNKITLVSSPCIAAAGVFGMGFETPTRQTDVTQDV